MNRNFYELLSYLGDGVYVIDQESRIIYVNDAALDMLGFTREAMIGNNAHELFHIDCNGYVLPQEECHISAVLIDGQPYMNHKECFRTQDGGILRVSVTSTPYRDEEGGAVLTVFRDIGLEEALAAKSRFISKISHELRTPLNAMINFTEQVLEDFDEIADDSRLRDENREYLKRAVNSAKRLHQMIDELIHYTIKGDSDHG